MARRGPPKCARDALDRHAVAVHAARPAVRKVRRWIVARSFSVISRRSQPTSRSSNPVAIIATAANMWATTEVLRLCAAVVVCVLAGVFSRGLRRDRTARAAVLLLAAVAAHLLFPLLWRRGAPAPLLHVLLVASLAASPAFWLPARVHFDDDFRLRPKHLVIAAAFLAIGYVSWLGGAEGRLPGVLFAPANRRFWAVLPRLLGLTMVLHALLGIYVGAGADLILPRRRARFAVLTVSGSYVLLV